MKVRRMGFALGGEVTGVDLREPLDQQTFENIREAWFENVVLCFPGQDLTPEQQIAFCSRFGTLDDHRDRTRMRRPDFPSVTMILNKPITIAGKQMATLVADTWHTDLAFRTRPTPATFLQARELPTIGGDTMFANLYLAYESLSPKLRELIEPLEAVHDVVFSPDYPPASPELKAQIRQTNPPVVHRVVRVHPETGRRALYLGGFVRNFVGMTESESKPLVDFLNAHATRYEFVYRHRWRQYDFVMWDNRCALHYAVPDYDRSESRVMQRCSLFGEETGREAAASG